MMVVEQTHGYMIIFELTKPIQPGFVGPMLLISTITSHAEKE